MGANRGLAQRVTRDLSAQHRDAMPQGSVESHLAVINQVADVSHVAEFRDNVAALGDDDKWLSAAKQSFLKGSPSSAHVIFEQVKRGKHLSLRETFQFELGLSVQFTRHADLAEGVRALLIDKDQNPQWSPATLEAVTAEMVETYFSSPWGDEGHPLADL